MALRAIYGTSLASTVSFMLIEAYSLFFLGGHSQSWMNITGIVSAIVLVFTAAVSHGVAEKDTRTDKSGIEA